MAPQAVLEPTTPLGWLASAIVVLDRLARRSASYNLRETPTKTGRGSHYTLRSEWLVICPKRRRQTSFNPNPHALGYFNAAMLAVAPG